MNKIPRGVWVLGFVSMFMDMSSEMAHAVLPLYLVGTLGASVALVGLIEGLAEFTAQVMKLFSGMASDLVKSRKWLAVFGYALSALTKPLFPLATAPIGILTARLADRVGKGIRGSPRDAMVADFTPPELRGGAYGLRQALDTVGAVLGPLVAVALLWWAWADVKGVLWVACIPAVFTVLILVFALREPERVTEGKAPPTTWPDLFAPAKLGAPFWSVFVFGLLLATARLSEAFLVLKAQDAGLPLGLVPLVMVAMSLIYLVAVYPAGTLADRVGMRGLMIAGMIALLCSQLLLAQKAGVWIMWAGVLFWGLHMGLTQGLIGKMVADAAPPQFRGTSFGYFNIGYGLASLASTFAAGTLWDWSGPGSAFYFGAIASAATLLVLLITATHYRSQPV